MKPKKDDQLLVEGLKYQSEGNLQKALFYFDLSGGAGNPAGNFSAGQILESQANYTEAHEYYKKAIVQGSAEAMASLANMYQYGLHVKKNEMAALHWYEKAALLGESMSMYELSSIYLSEKPVRKDYKKHAYWLERAAQSGFSMAIESIARSYLDGRCGFRKNIQKAIFWYRNLARTHEVDSTLADLYFFGRGYWNEDFIWKYDNQTQKYFLPDNVVALIRLDLFEQEYKYQNIARAIYWYKKFGRWYDEHAMGKLSFFYENGLFVDKDSEKARYWYLLSVKKKKYSQLVLNSQYHDLQKWKWIYKKRIKRKNYGGSI